jgi:tetratricopeptide (TPR) repeat protein
VLDVGEGEVGLSIVGRLNFFVGVGAFKHVLALARGTRFSVAAQPGCAAGPDRPRAPCVTVRLDEGRMTLETRRPLQLGSAVSVNEAAGRDETVLVGEAMRPGETRELSLAPEAFALRFDSPQQADDHYVGELERARAGRDPDALMPALRNLLVVRRLTDRHADALALAEEGLVLARAQGNEPWALRFLIDQALATWNLRRDRSAFDLFERAFEIGARLDPDAERADLAALYVRYGNIRFDARDRQNPAADIDLAERLIRRSLELRRGAPGEPPTLALSMSHYALGMLLRLGRKDAAGSSAELNRALDIRRQVLGTRDDVTTAEMMSEAALSLEALADGSPPACPGEGVADPYEPLRRLFDDSLGMLERLSPGRPYRSYAAVARRSADVRRRIGDDLQAHCSAAAIAEAQWRAARDDYRRSLTAWSQQAGNTTTERRFAWRGLAMALIALQDWRGAGQPLAEALSLTREQYCSTPPSPEAPSDRWVADLLELMARQADRVGETERADSHRRAKARPAAICGSTAGTEPGR